MAYLSQEDKRAWYRRDREKKIKAYEARVAAQEQQECRSCRIVKTIDEFYKYANSYCKKCQQEISKARTAHDREFNPHKIKQKENARRKYRYGITEDQFISMRNEQDDLCFICGEPEKPNRNGEVKLLSIDHDHDTGIVRRLLCRLCNQGIGSLRDDPKLLRKAAEYLEGFGR